MLLRMNFLMTRIHIIINEKWKQNVLASQQFCRQIHSFLKEEVRRNITTFGKISSFTLSWADLFPTNECQAQPGHHLCHLLK